MASPLDLLWLPDRIMRAIRLLESLDAKAERMLQIAERLDAKASAVLDLGGRIEHEATLVHQRAEEINRTAKELLLAIPTLEQAVGLVTPLEGAVDRLGRMVDRLPGGRARRPPAKPPE